MNEIEKIFLNKIIFKKYQIIKKEGKGAFTTVFSAKNIINQELVAVKIDSSKMLEKEAYLLFNSNKIGIPKFISYGHVGKYNILVQELLGKTLSQLFINNKKKDKNIRLKDMLMAGIQIIDRIKYIHSNNILHMDIKPDNFLVGNPDDSIIYIIDFGLSRKFRSSRTGKHTPFTRHKVFSGNLIYSSFNVMRGIEPSRRDDLESIGYMLIFLYTNRLPWSNLKSKNYMEINRKIFLIKRSLSTETLCENVPNEMNDFMKYIKSLGFEEKPKYNYLTSLLEMMLSKINQINDLKFSWILESLKKNNNKSNDKSGIKQRKISPFYNIFESINKRSRSEKKRHNKLEFNNFRKNISEKKNNQNIFKKNFIIERNNNNYNIINNNNSKNSLRFKGSDIENESNMNSSFLISNNNNNIKIIRNNNFIDNEPEKEQSSISNIQLNNKSYTMNENINYWKKKADIEQNIFKKHDNDLDVEYNFLIDYKKLFPSNNDD